MTTTTYGDISQRTAAWAATEMLAHAEPQLVLSKFGLAKPIPKNTAEGAKFRRPIPFGAATTPLQEGVTPAAQVMAYEDVPVTLDQYGAVVEITDKVADMSEDPVLSDASMLCGEQAGETLEQLIWGILRAGTSVFYANGTTRGDVNTAISLDKQRAVTRFLKAQKAKKVTKMVSSSANFDTSAIDAAYIAFAHTNLEADIRDMAGFVPTEKYGQMKALPYEIGKVEDVRYILTPTLTHLGANGNATLNGMLNDGAKVYVYPVVYIGMDSYGLTTLKGAAAIKPMVLNPGTPRGGDPLGQKGTVGWKTYFKAVVLNQAWMARLEVGASSL